MGASPSAIGTARAQHHLRQIFVTLNLFTLNQPEVIIAEKAKRELNFRPRPLEWLQTA
jgi:chromate reductase, NAD(P)H dehydrogenase (quinone)